MSKFLVLFFLSISIGALGAQALPSDGDNAIKQLGSSPRHGEWVTIKTPSGSSLDLWVVYPERKTKSPLVIVIHEIFGLNDWARAVADQLAAEGFVAIAPDFLSGKGPEGKGTRSLTTEEARAQMGTLKPLDVFKQIDAAVAYGKALPASTGQYGVVGFCWGGAISFGYATYQPQLGAAVVYYGTSPATEALKTIKAPVLGLYGGNDARVNNTVPDAAAEMKKLSKTFETHFFEGAGHAFLRQQVEATGANLKAAQNAWPRTLSFLRKYLEPKAAMAQDHQDLWVNASLELCEDEECE